MAASLLDKMVLSWLPLLLLLSSTTAIQVTPGSPCTSVCLDSPDGDSARAAASTTNSSDIVCDDVDYFSSSTGQKFKDCITCLQTSNAVSGEEDDVSWFLCKLVKKRRSPDIHPHIVWLVSNLWDPKTTCGTPRLCVSTTTRATRRRRRRRAISPAPVPRYKAQSSTAS